jgi:hypothetical protein
MKPETNNEPISVTQKAFMYSCLIPVFGFVPSVMALLSDRGSKQLKNTAKGSVIMVLVWLLVSATLGQNDHQVTTDLLKGTFTSVYFVASIYLMRRLSKGQP